MNTLAALQAENGLWHELWVVAADEAYSAKDASRRMDEMIGLSERDVVEVYFGYHPEMKRWAEKHIEAGTCEAAIFELREALKSTRERRAENRPVRNTATKPSGRTDWLRPFKPGPDPQSPMIEGKAEAPATSSSLRSPAEALFLKWASSLPEYPTKPEIDNWAKANGYSTGPVRSLHAKHNPRTRGIKRKRQD